MCPQRGALCSALLSSALLHSATAAARGWQKTFRPGLKWTGRDEKFLPSRKKGPRLPKTPCTRPHWPATRPARRSAGQSASQPTDRPAGAADRPAGQLASLQAGACTMSVWCADSVFTKTPKNKKALGLTTNNDDNNDHRHHGGCDGRPLRMASFRAHPRACPIGN